MTNALADVRLWLPLAVLTMATPASADGTDWNWHVQTTVTVQANTAFRSPYSGPNSFLPDTRGKETFDATLYLGYRPWQGAEIWANPEIDQGFGLSNTLGLGGYSSGEAYKVGARNPYLRLQRLFLRQTVSLGGEESESDADLNQFAALRPRRYIAFTIGKFAVTDIFDASPAAHDPRRDFLNWSLLDTGSFDYAADAWGYTAGAAADLHLDTVSLRAGLFDMSDVPNSAHLDSFHQVQAVVEAEKRFTISDEPGAIRVTAFASRARMGAFDQAVAAGPVAPDTADVRRYRTRTGVAVSGDQAFGPVSVFIRAGASDGHFETYEFTDIDSTAAAGMTVKGNLWDRDADSAGLAAVVNDISRQHAAYLAVGGLGPLVGDGQLPHKGRERIAEAWYSLGIGSHVAITLDGQYVRNPAYNRDRGPVTIMGARLHVQY
jgi:high affinity Mn2+ porin